MASIKSIVFLAALAGFAASDRPAQAASEETAGCVSRIVGVLGEISVNDLANGLLPGWRASDASELAGYRLFADTLLTSHAVMQRELGEVIILRRELASLDKFEEASKSLDTGVDLQIGKALQVLRKGLNARVQREAYAANVNRTFLEENLRAYCDYMAAQMRASGVARQAPPSQPTRPPTTQPRQPRIDYGTSAVLQMEGEPEPSAPYATWPTVKAGDIEQKGPAYSATYTWSPELPQTIGPEGVDVTLDVVATSTERIAAGIGMRGGFDFVKSASDNTPIYPVNIAAYAERGTDHKFLTVHIKPQKSYNPGQKVTLEIGASYGPNVVYHYVVVRTGQ